MEKSRKRSSILKKLNNDDVSPTLPFNKPLRRISFSGKKSVKEFIAGDDKATIWGTSYEESANAEHSSSNNFTLSSLDQGAGSVKNCSNMKKTNNEPPLSLSNKENLCENQMESGEADMSIDETIHRENERTVEPVNPILKLINREVDKEHAIVAKNTDKKWKDFARINDNMELSYATTPFNINKRITIKDADYCNYKKNATENQRKTIIFDKNEELEETKKDFIKMESSIENAKDVDHCNYKKMASEEERKTILFHNNIKLEQETFDFEEKLKNHSAQTVESKSSIETPQIFHFIRRNQKLPIFPNGKFSALVAKRSDSDRDTTQTGANCDQKDSNNEKVTMLNDLPQFDSSPGNTETNSGANCDQNQICHNKENSSNRKTQIFNDDIKLDSSLKTAIETAHNKDMSCCGETSDAASRHTRTFNSGIELSEFLKVEREIKAKCENAPITLEAGNEPVSESHISQRSKIFNFKTNYSSIYSKLVSKSKNQVEDTEYVKQGVVLKRKSKKRIESGQKVVKLFDETDFNFSDIMSDYCNKSVKAQSAPQNPKSQGDCQIESTEQYKVELCKEWIDLSGLQLLGDVSQVENSSSPMNMSLDQMENVKVKTFEESHQVNKAVINESNYQNEEIPTPNSKPKFPQLITCDSDNKLPDECTLNTRTPQLTKEKLLSSHLSENEVICEEDANVSSNPTCYKFFHETPGLNTFARDHTIDMKRKTLIFRDSDGDIGADLESLAFPCTPSDNIIYRNKHPAEFLPEKSNRKTRIFSTNNDIDLTTLEDGATSSNLCSQVTDYSREPCTANHNMNQTEMGRPFAVNQMLNDHRKEGRKTVIFHNENDLEITLQKPIKNLDSQDSYPDSQIEANVHPVQHESSHGENRTQYFKNRASNVSMEEDYISSNEISVIKERNESNVEGDIKINNKRGTIHFKTGKNNDMEVTICGEESEILFQTGNILLPRKTQDQEQTKYVEETNEHISNNKINTKEEKIDYEMEDLRCKEQSSKDINMEEKNLSISFMPKKSPRKTLFLNKVNKPQCNISGLKKDLFNNTINRTNNQSTSPGGMTTIVVTPCMSPEAPSSANFRKIPQSSTLLYNEETPESLRNFNSLYCPDTTEALCNLDPSCLLSRAKRKPSLKKSSSCGRINYSRNSDLNRPTDSHIKKFVDLTCNISTSSSSSENDIEKTKLDLVESLESTASSDLPYSVAEDSEKIELPCEIVQINRHDKDENVIGERGKDNNQSDENAKTIQKNRGKCFQCGVTFMKSDTTFQNLISEPRTNVKNEELDFSVYNKFEGVPSLDEILSSYLEKVELNENSENSFNESISFPTVPPVKFLFKNYFQELEADLLDFKKQLQPKPIYPSIPSFEFLLKNKLKCTNSLWFLNDLYAPMNLLEIRHKRVRTIVMYVHTKTVSGSEGKSIEFEGITIQKCNLYGKRNAFDLILENEVLPNFPSDLLQRCQHSHKNDIFALLQELGHMSREAIQIVDNLMEISIETGAYIMKNDKDECYMKKRARINSWSPPLDIVIRIKGLKNITHQDIVLPETYSINDPACDLPAGLEFLNQFLSNPFSFVKLIN